MKNSIRLTFITLGLVWGATGISLAFNLASIVTREDVSVFNAKLGRDVFGAYAYILIAVQLFIFIFLSFLLLKLIRPGSKDDAKTKTDK